MRFEAKLKRLESLVGIGQRCARCRLIARESDEKKINKSTSDYIVSTCEECGTEYRSSLERYSVSERQALRMLEAYSDDEIFTDPKPYALLLWLKFRPALIEAMKKTLKSFSKEHNQSKPKTKVERLYAELTKERNELEKKKRVRLLAKYGKRFPEQDALVNDLIGNNFEEPELKAAEARGKLETIIWGAPLPETIAEIEIIKQGKGGINQNGI